jgi:hypothetical protein
MKSQADRRAQMLVRLVLLLPAPLRLPAMRLVEAIPFWLVWRGVNKVRSLARRVREIRRRP